MIWDMKASAYRRMDSVRYDCSPSVSARTAYHVYILHYGEQFSFNAGEWAQPLDEVKWWR